MKSILLKRLYESLEAICYSRWYVYSRLKIKISNVRFSHKADRNQVNALYGNLLPH